MTGTGDAFSGPQSTPAARLRLQPRQWDEIYFDGKRLLQNLLDIEVLMDEFYPGMRLADSELAVSV